MTIQLTDKEIKEMKQTLEKIEGMKDPTIIAVLEPGNDEVQAMDENKKSAA